MSTPAIELRNVSLSFESKQVLTECLFRSRAGETLILLGVTGSGKSVLLKLMLGLLKPDGGQVLIEGQDLVPLSGGQPSAHSPAHGNCISRRRAVRFPFGF